MLQVVSSVVRVRVHVCVCVCVCRLVQEAEGCAALVQLLSDSQALSRSGAASTITNMAPSQHTR